MKKNSAKDFYDEACVVLSVLEAVHGISGVLEDVGALEGILYYVYTCGYLDRDAEDFEPKQNGLK